MGNFSVNYGFIVDKNDSVDNVDNRQNAEPDMATGQEAEGDVKSQNTVVDTVDEVLLLKMQAPHSYTKGISSIRSTSMFLYFSLKAAGDILPVLMESISSLVNVSLVTYMTFLSGSFSRIK